MKRLILILFCAPLLLGAEPESPTPEERLEISASQIEASQANEAALLSMIRTLQSQIETLQAQQAVREAAQRHEAKVEALRTKYSAEGYDLGPEGTWVKRPER